LHGFKDLRLKELSDDLKNLTTLAEQINRTLTKLLSMQTVTPIVAQPCEHPNSTTQKINATTRNSQQAFVCTRGYANAVDYLIAKFEPNEYSKSSPYTPSALIPQQRQTKLPTATVFIYNLAPVLAQAIIHIIHTTYCLIATNLPRSLVVGAVQADSLVKETPFRSTGPGPPSGDLFFAFSEFLKGAKPSSIVRQDYIINM